MCSTCGHDNCGCANVATPSQAGAAGKNGLSAYELWLNAGNSGSLAEFFQSMKGEDGLSAYDIAVQNGFAGTQQQWLDSLNGEDGEDALLLNTSLGASFEVPVLGGTTSLVVGSTALMATGRWLDIRPGGQFRIAGVPGPNNVFITNPGGGQGWPDGVALNAAPGTVVEPNGLDTQVTLCGVPGGPGAAGEPGEPGDPGPPQPPAEISVVTTMPSGAPEPGYATQIYVDPSGVTHLIQWSGSTWMVVSQLSGASGAKILWINANPNTQPSTYGNIGDEAHDTSVDGSIRVWQKVTSSTWTLRATIPVTGLGIPVYSFYAGKTSDQPVPVGLSDPYYINFEDTTSAGHHSGGAWVGNVWTAPAGVPSPMVFVLENLRVFRPSGSGEKVDFDISITLAEAGGEGDTQTVLATATLELTPGDDEATLVVLNTPPVDVMPGDKMRVSIEPQSPQAEQWYIDKQAKFYNQA